MSRAAGAVLQAVLGVALLMVVMRALLRQAAAARAEPAEVI